MPVRWIVVCNLLFLICALQGSRAAERRSAVVEVVEKAGPAVVNIRTEQVVSRGRGNPFFGFSDPFFEEFFQNLVPPQTYKTQSLGSGVIIDQRGYVLTNSHVVEKASKIFVALPDSSEELEATLIGQAPYIDLAVLKIAGEKKYPFLRLGRSDDLLIGETVIAIGNPLGLGHSITTGVISAAIRRIPMEEKIFSVFVQTDALINPGNSGGPLLNINGDLIGINTAIARQAQGIGFAIPIDSVKRVLPDLMKGGRLRRPYHGIIPATVSKDFVPSGRGGVLVSRVDADSPAQKAGVRYGDVILALDGIPIGSPAEMQAMLNTYIPGNTLHLKVQRGFDGTEKTVILGEFPKGYGYAYGKEVFGITVSKSKGGGVRVDSVVAGSAADKAGIEKGDLIGEIGGHPVENPQDYAEIVERQIGFEPLRFLVVRGRRGYYVDLP
jgi:serine protease Do